MFQQLSKSSERFSFVGHASKWLFWSLWCFSSWSSWWLLVCSIPEHSSYYSGNLSLIGVSAMKTDEILMTIVAAKLLGLFKNDQQKPKTIEHPIPLPIPRPPFIYLGGCNRPRKCRKTFKYFDYLNLPESYEDDAFDGNYDNLDEAFPNGSYGEDLYDIGSKYHQIDIDSYPKKLRYGYPSQSTYMPNDYRDSTNDEANTGNQQKEYHEYYDDQAENIETDQNESEQIPLDTKEYENITPVPKRKKLRKYFELKLNSLKPTKTKQRTKTKRKQKRTRKLRKPPVIAENQMEMQYEYVTTGYTTLPPSTIPETQEFKEVIHLGEKLSNFQKKEKTLKQETDADTTENGTEVSNEEMEEEKIITVSTSASVATTIGQNNKLKNETSKKMAMSYKYQAENDQSHSNDEPLQDSESKVIKMVPKTVQKYLERIKLWNKRLNKDTNKSKSESMNSHQNTTLIGEKNEQVNKSVEIVPRNPTSKGFNVKTIKQRMPSYSAYNIPGPIYMIPLAPPLLVNAESDVIDEHVLYPIMKKSDVTKSPISQS